MKNKQTELKKENKKKKFVNEAVKSDCTYPKEYKGPKPIAEQVAILRKLFPEFKNATYDKNIATQPLPEGAEGWFAIPRWEKFGSTYRLAVNEVLATINFKRTIRDYRIGGIAKDEYLRQYPKTAKAFQNIGGKQKGYDILIVPCQFGLRHRGLSLYRAHKMMKANEFGLSVFAVGIMLLTHPEREVKLKQLHLYCAGDELTSIPSLFDIFGCLPYAPRFGFYDGKIDFFPVPSRLSFIDNGSASGFLSQ